MKGKFGGGSPGHRGGNQYYPAARIEKVLQRTGGTLRGMAPQRTIDGALTLDLGERKITVFARLVSTLPKALKDGHTPQSFCEQWHYPYDDFKRLIKYGRNLLRATFGRTIQKADYSEPEWIALNVAREVDRWRGQHRKDAFASVKDSVTARDKLGRGDPAAALALIKLLDGTEDDPKPETDRMNFFGNTMVTIQPVPTGPPPALPDGAE